MRPPRSSERGRCASEQFENLHARSSPRLCATDRRRSTAESALVDRASARKRATCTRSVPSTSRGVTMPRRVEHDARRARKRAPRVPRPSCRAFGFEKHRFAVRVTHRHAHASSRRRAGPDGSSILRVSAATFFSSPVSPVPSNEPTCGTTLRKIGVRTANVPLGASPPGALPRRERFEPGAAGAADGLIRRDAHAAQARRRVRSARARRTARSPCSSRPERCGVRARAACGLTSGTTSGTPRRSGTSHELSMTTMPRVGERLRRARARVVARGEEHDVEGAVGDDARGRRRRDRHTTRRERRTAFVAIARRERASSVDRHVALFEHAQDRFADDAGRADDGDSHGESPMNSDSRPMTSPCCVRTPRTASSMPRHERRRARTSRAGSSASRRRRRRSLLDARPARATARYGSERPRPPAPSMRRAVSFAVPLGASRLRVVMQFDDLRGREIRAPLPRAKRIISTAPIAKFGTSSARRRSRFVAQVGEAR